MPFALSSCGGGGGRSAALTANPQGSFTPASLSEPLSSRVTRYYPSITGWHLYFGSNNRFWTSAIGSTPGLSVSMTNPFEKVEIALIPTESYNNPGQVTFYIDGAQKGTLDLSQDVPFEGYKEGRVNYYTIAEGLTNDFHTVMMVIATGTVAFDGWRIMSNNSFTLIDASASNDVEYDAILAAAKLRAGVEEYYEKHGVYPDPGTVDLGAFLVSKNCLNSIPDNPYTDQPMRQLATDTFYAGDYRYTRAQDGDYELSFDGGTGTLVRLTPLSASTDFFTVELTSPAKHVRTVQPYIDISGTVTSRNESNMQICCGLGGAISFPVADGAFTNRISLAEGRNDLGITLFDPFGNEVKFSITATKDTTPPQITLLAPYPLTGAAGSQMVNVATSSVIVEILSEASATVTINDVAVAESTRYAGVFPTTVTLGEGSNIISIAAADTLGNSATKTYTIIYTPPAQAARASARRSRN